MKRHIASLDLPRDNIFVAVSSASYTWSSWTMWKSIWELQQDKIPVPAIASHKVEEAVRHLGLCIVLLTFLHFPSLKTMAISLCILKYYDHVRTCQLRIDTHFLQIQFYNSIFTFTKPTSRIWRVGKERFHHPLRIAVSLDRIHLIRNLPNFCNLFRIKLDIRSCNVFFQILIGKNTDLCKKEFQRCSKRSDLDFLRPRDGNYVLALSEQPSEGDLT